MSAKVYFTSGITPEGVVAVYDALGVELPGKVAIKVHSGEVGNQNFIRPDFFKPMVDRINGTIVESNTGYPTGKRHSSRSHWQTMELHGWTSIAPVDILDEDGTIQLPVPDGVRIKNDIVGSHLANYDSILVLSHFKGHPMGGFGGAIKNIAIGLASSRGKLRIHSGGRVWRLLKPDQDAFLDALADAAKAVVTHFGTGMAFVNVMKAMSVDCDCVAKARPPEMDDIGILASLDPVALDQACVDLVYGADDPAKASLIERIEARHGVRTLEAAEALGVGKRQYELVRL